MMQDDEDASSIDEELQNELQEDHEANNPELLDETVFNKFATGELDLPEEADADLDESEDDIVHDEDSELEAYYEELGIDPSEMHPKRGKKTDQEQLYKKQKKQDIIKERASAVKQERNDILDAMMEKARTEPSYKTLTRII